MVRANQIQKRVTPVRSLSAADLDFNVLTAALSPRIETKFFKSYKYSEDCQDSRYIPNLVSLYTRQAIIFVTAALTNGKLFPRFSVMNGADLHVTNIVRKLHVIEILL